MNLPNKLTIVRILMVPAFVVILCFANLGKTGDMIALVIFVAASITDFLDGHIARKRGLITNFGKFMDPLADKLLVYSAAACLVWMQRFPAWGLVIFLAREFIVSGIRLIAASDGVVIAASMWGKAKTVSQMIMIGLLLHHEDFLWWHITENVVTLIAIVLTIISMIDYIVKNRRVIKGN